MLDAALSDKEQKLLELFTKNEELVNVVEKVILGVLNIQGVPQKGIKAYPLINAALVPASNASSLNKSNEQIGQETRAIWEAVNILGKAFNDIKLYNKQETGNKVVKNEAR